MDWWPRHISADTGLDTRTRVNGREAGLIMVVRYIAYTWQGDKVEGVLDVDREDEAREALQRDDLIPYRLVRVRPLPALSGLAPLLFKPKPQELIEFTRGLAALLRSGIPMRDGLMILRGQGGGLGMREVVRRLVVDVEEGLRLSEACAKHPRVFSGFYLRLLRVGEATGGLFDSLEQLSEALVKRKNMGDKVKAALVYPAISIVVAIFVAIILLTYSLPAIIGLLTEFGGELPIATKILVAVSDFVQAYKMAILLSLAGAVVGVFLASKTERGNRVTDRVLLKTPVVGKVLMQSSLFSLTSTFSTLLRAGIPSMDALRLTRDSVNNVILREKLDRITEDVLQGNRLGLSFQQYWTSPQLLAQGIVTGEAAGDLPESLSNLADYYEQESARTVNSATELIQPAVIMLVALLVGFVATAVVSGVYAALDSIE